MFPGRVVVNTAASYVTKRPEAPEGNCSTFLHNVTNWSHRAALSFRPVTFYAFQKLKMIYDLSFIYLFKLMHLMNFLLT